MNLTLQQRATLREETARGFAKSAALHRERSALLQQLDTRMVCDDGHSTERVTKVRAALPLALIARLRGASHRFKPYQSVCCQPHSQHISRCCQQYDGRPCPDVLARRRTLKLQRHHAGHGSC